MDRENNNVQSKLESITRKWWFLLLFILFQFFPAYAEKGYDPSKWGEFIGHTLEHAFASSVEWLYPVFKIVPMILVISIINITMVISIININNQYFNNQYFNNQ